MNNTGKSSLALLAGIAIGAGIGVLLAPKAGKELRDELATKAGDIKNDILDVANEKIAAIRKQVENKVDKLESKGEKVINEAKAHN